MLIPCPNCGKPISDLAKECIHCKTVINAEPEEQKEQIDFMQLSSKEQKELQKQFVSEEPEIAKPMVKDALLHRIFVICGIFLLCFLAQAANRSASSSFKANGFSKSISYPHSKSGMDVSTC